MLAEVVLFHKIFLLALPLQNLPKNDEAIVHGHQTADHDEWTVYSDGEDDGKDEADQRAMRPDREQRRTGLFGAARDGDASRTTT